MSLVENTRWLENERGEFCLIVWNFWRRHHSSSKTDLASIECFPSFFCLTIQFFFFFIFFSFYRIKGRRRDISEQQERLLVTLLA